MSNRKAYTAQNYKDWKEAAQSLFRDQWAGRPKIPKHTIACIVTQFYGNDASVDNDNIAGSVFDALVKAEVLENDNVNNLPFMMSAWERCKRQQWIEVELHFQMPTIIWHDL